MSIPDEKGQITQPNNGTVYGNVYATYGVDFQTEKGKIRFSGPVTQQFSNTDNANFNGYASAILPFNGKWIAVSDKVFEASSPTGTWSESSITGDEPNSGNAIMDGIVFDGQLLVTTTTDVKSYNGSSWTSWWQTTLGASALTVGNKHLMTVAWNGNLYLVDNGNKLYKVSPTGSPATETTSGAGTLDFSATPHIFNCLESNSNRIWIGTTNDEGEAVIIEWDGSATSLTANRIHPIGSIGVMCIAIWNDTPIALLRNGKVKVFDGSTFVDMDGVQFPTAVTEEDLADDFVHNNGWAIIDNLPHFLVKGGVVTSGNTYADESSSLWNMPSGVWCLDPQIGLYNRFPCGLGVATQDDYGQHSLNDVGALAAVETGETKFLASYEAYTDPSTVASLLVSYDGDRGEATRGLIASQFSPLDEEMVELFMKPLASGEQVDVYFRHENTTQWNLNGYWSTTKVFNTTDDTTNIEVGNVLLIKNGSGGGQLLRIAAIERGAVVDMITVEEAPDFVVVDDNHMVNVLNFKRAYTLTNKTLDNHSFDIPSLAKKRKTQVLFYYRQASGNTMETDYVIIK